MIEWITDSLPGKDNDIVEGSTAAPCGHIHFATVSTIPTVFPALSSFLIEAAFFIPHFSHWNSCLFYVFSFMTWYPWSKMFLGGKKSLLLKIIQKRLDKRTFQIPFCSNNQWIHASQPFRCTSMKYKTCVFNFLHRLLLVNPRRSWPCEPIKRTVLSHLPPWASQQSQLHLSFLIIRAISILSGRICKDSCWASQTFGGGKTWGRLLHSSIPFYWNSCGLCI